MADRCAGTKRELEMQHGSQCSCDVNNIKNNPVLAIAMSEQDAADGSQENTRYKRLNAASLLIYEKMKTNTYTELLQSSSMRRRMILQQGYRVLVHRKTSYLLTL